MPYQTFWPASHSASRFCRPPIAASSAFGGLALDLAGERREQRQRGAIAARQNRGDGGDARGFVPRGRKDDGRARLLHPSPDGGIGFCRDRRVQRYALGRIGLGENLLGGGDPDGRVFRHQRQAGNGGGDGAPDRVLDFHLVEGNGRRIGDDDVAIDRIGERLLAVPRFGDENGAVIRADDKASVIERIEAARRQRIARRAQFADHRLDRGVIARGGEFGDNSSQRGSSARAVGAKASRKRPKRKATKRIDGLSRGGKAGRISPPGSDSGDQFAAAVVPRHFFVSVL
ncbi:MAG: hypothetical protein IPL47_14245 [Phyllobacteriaceae bacterium]|nr:hypothetical protein [Phyllobacteriaceae bacterium]